MNAIEDKPYIVSWNLTKQCNLSCPHCYIDAHPSLNSAHENELTRDDAQSVINALSSLNNNLMLILSGGEPMLREDIFDIVQSASSARLIIVLGSNGTLLTRDSLRMLKDAGLMGVGISIDSTDYMHHDSFRGYKGAWDLSVSALRYSREAGLETQVDVTLTDQNCKEVDDFVELGVSMGAKAVNFFFLVCTGRAMRTDISTENYDVVLKKIAKISMNERRLMVRARCAPHFYRMLYEGGFPVQKGMRGCLAGRHYIRIDPEGNITPCPYMPLTIGNIKEKPLSAIWEESAPLKLLRNVTYNGRCGACEYTEICGGCRARALAVKEDIMGEDPLCNYTPQSGRQVVFSETLHGQCEWTPEAKERIKKVPFFMQGIVTKIIEAKARERGRVRGLPGDFQMKDSSDEKIIDRRGFLKTAFAEITKKIVELSVETEKKPVRKRKYLRPPGAVEESLFLSRCTRCNECIKVCPHFSVRGIDSDVESGIGTPIIIPEITPCRLCPDLPCISVCKDKALMPAGDIKEVRIGVALIDRTNCIDYSGDGTLPCQKCYKECPLKDYAIYLEDSRPVIRAEKCTGCGICENVCAAIISPPVVRVYPVDIRRIR